MRILLIAILYGLLDLLPAMAASPRLKTIAATVANGGSNLSGVTMVASLVPPSDSTTIISNTVSGQVYSPLLTLDSTQSGSDGKVAVRMPLTSDLTPTGTRVRIVLKYRDVVMFDTQNLPTPNLALTDTAWTCFQKATGQTTSCP